MYSAPNPTELPLPDTALPRATLVAAEVVMAHLTGRAPLRLERVTCEGIEYAIRPDPQVLRQHRALLEDVVMTALAQAEAARFLGAREVDVTKAWQLLREVVCDPDEREALSEYLCVLRARTRAVLRRSWAEVQVVAAGLLEYGELSAEGVSYRVRCAQSIRGRLSN